MKRENLFGDDSGEVEETSKKLNELGLPSLMERWHTDPSKYIIIDIGIIWELNNIY